MERTIISWNLPNWITITIMAATGYALFAAVAQFVKSQQGQMAQGGGGY